MLPDFRTRKQRWSVVVDVSVRELMTVFRLIMSKMVSPTLWSDVRFRAWRVGAVCSLCFAAFRLYL